MQGKKRTMWKRALARLLVFAMLLTLLPVLPVGATDEGSVTEPPATETPTETPTVSPTVSPTETQTATRTTDPEPVDPPAPETKSISLTFVNAEAYEILAVTVDGMKVPEVDGKYSVTFEEAKTAYPLKMALQKKEDGMLYTITKADWNGEDSIDLASGSMVTPTENKLSSVELTVLKASGVDNNKPVFSTSELGEGLTGKLYSGNDSIVISEDSKSMTISGLVTDADVFSVTVNLNKDDPAATTVTKNVVPVTLAKATLTKEDVTVVVDLEKTNTTIPVEPVFTIGIKDKEGSSVSDAVKQYYTANAVPSSWDVAEASEEVAEKVEVEGKNRLRLKVASDNVNVTLDVSIGALGEFFSEVSGLEASVAINRKESTLANAYGSICADELKINGYILPEYCDGVKITYSVDPKDSADISIANNVVTLLKEASEYPASEYPDGKTFVISASTGTGTVEHKGGMASFTLKVTPYIVFEESIVQKEYWELDPGYTYKQTLPGEGWEYRAENTVENVTVASDGTVTFSKPASVTVVATRNKVVKRYTITVTKTKMELILESKEVEYGTKEHQVEYKITAVNAPDDENDTKRKISAFWAPVVRASLTWSIDSKKDHSVSNTGLVTFGNSSGSVTVKATMRDNDFVELETNPATCTLTVKEPAELIKAGLEVDKILDISLPNGDNGWYKPAVDKTATQNVVFAVIGGGYTISATRDFTGEKVDEKWKNQMTLADVAGNNDFSEGEKVGGTVYLKNSTTGIVYQYTLPGYKVDNSLPEIKSTAYEAVSKVVVGGITKIFAGTAKGRKLTIEIEATDKPSGVAKVEYYVGDPAKDENWKTVNKDDVSGKYIFTYEGSDFEHTIAYRVTDVAGNVFMTTDKNGTYIVDSVAPGITVTYTDITRYENGESYGEEGNAETKKMYSNIGFNVTVEVDETYFKDSIEAGKQAPEGNKFGFKMEVKTPSGAKPVEVVWKDNVATASIPKGNGDGAYEIIVSGMDAAGNAIEKTATYGTITDGTYTSVPIILDTKAPVATVAYTNPEKPAAFVDDNQKITDEASAATIVYDGTVKMTVVFTETNFNPDDVSITVEERNGVAVEGVGYVWDKEKPQTAIVTLPAGKNAELYYTVVVSGTDIAGNPIAYSVELPQFAANVSGDQYTSKPILVDNKAPEVTLDYSGETNKNAVDGFYTSRSADITVEDASFDSVACAVGSAYSGVNAKNDSVVAKTALNDTWTAAEATKWTKSIDFNAEDANYTFDLALKDNAGNPAVITVKGDDKGQNITNKDGKYHTEFTVDDTRPVVTEVKYTTSVPNTVVDIITKIGEKTYAFFTNSTDSGKKYPLVITVTGEDAVSGVQEFTYTYTRDETASKTNKDTFSETLSYKDEKTIANYVLGAADIHEELKFPDPENGGKLSMFGQFTYLLKDYSGNLSKENPDKPYNDTTLKIGEVLDSIAPELKVSYGSPSYYDALGKYFYNSTGVDVTFTMKEINFFNGEDVEIYVNSGNKGTYATGEFLRVNDVEWTPTGNADEYSYVFHMQHDTEYQFKVVYKDRSANNMNASDMLGTQTYEYYSPILVLDTTNPVVQISYNAPYQTTDIAYYNTTCTYNIHVTERNFDPVAATAAITKYLSAHNIDNVAQGVPAVGEWRNDGDEHYATIVFSSDARYEFDMIYTDPAGNTDMSADKRSFCVDTTAPSNLGISYNSDIAGQPTDGNGGTTIYGKDTVQVTLTAYDVTAGVETITYSGTSAAGVSAVNVPVNSTSVSVNATSSSVTHTFSIPAQFAGRVSFTAVDRSGNRTSTNEADEPLVIVDNMAPTANIVFTTTPSGYDEDDKPYYDQDFIITIEIDEANFNAEDVTVTVLKDDAVESHDIVWTDGEGDIHTAEISLSGDGVYVVTVQYTDKSGNDMVTTAEYMKETGNPGEVQSEEMTLDTEDPELTITSAQTGNDAHDTAYDGSKDPENQKTIGFVIASNDTNLNKDSFELSIEGYFVDNGDLHTFKKVDDVLAMDEDNDGEKDIVVKPITGSDDYAVEIKNLELDGVYRITATVEDYATNASTTPAALVSVNRNGSTFYIEDESLIGLLDSYYANEEIPVEIKEVNVEKLRSSEMSVVRDSATKKLEEGTEYTVSSESGVDLQDNNDHWNIYTYTAVKENFAEEGAYTVQTMSNTTADPDDVDAGTDVTATNTNQEGAEIKFLIDKTQPSGTFSGLIGGEHYNGESHEFTLSVNDNAALDSIVLFVDGQEIHPDTEVSGQDFALSYTLPEKVGSYSVKFSAADKAGNLYDLGDDNAIEVYVNSNFILLYAKEFTVAGILLLVMIGVLVAVVVSRKKKAKAA